jgi:hypothetical protein
MREGAQAVVVDAEAAFTSGRKFSITTSAFSANCLNATGGFRFSISARLLRRGFWKPGV